jgi:hypothetical protein
MVVERIDWKEESMKDEGMNGMQVSMTNDWMMTMMNL